MGIEARAAAYRTDLQSFECRRHRGLEEPLHSTSEGVVPDDLHGAMGALPISHAPHLGMSSATALHTLATTVSD